MKKLFLIDAYALIFKYYYAFLGHPMRNIDGKNTSIIFGFTKFLRDIIARENPDLLGVAFDPKGGSFRKNIDSSYKANRPATPEDIIASIPYIKRVVEAMRIPILEVDGFEADDVIGTLAFRGSEAGYDVYMVTPDKDYGQLVGEHRKIYKQKGDGVEIIDKAAIRSKYGIEDPLLVRDILALWGDVSDNIPGVPGIGEKGASRLVQQWGSIENIIDNLDQIGGKTKDNIIKVSIDKLRTSKVLTSIRLDVPIEFDESGLAVCNPDIDALKTLYTELGFRSFLYELKQTNIDGNKTNDTKVKSLIDSATIPADVLQGSLFDGLGDASSSQPKSVINDNEVSDIAVVDDVEIFHTSADTPHVYHIIYDEMSLRNMVAHIGTYQEFCFDLETSGFDIFNDKIVGISFAVEPHEAWYLPISFPSANGSDNYEERLRIYMEILNSLFANEKIAKIGQNMKFDLLFLRNAGIKVCGRKFDTMLLHYLLDPESRHGMNALSERYLSYIPIEIESLIGRGAKQISIDKVGVEQVAEYAAEDADITIQLYRVLKLMVEKEDQMTLYERIEEPMIDVLADMEWTGVHIDSTALTKYSATLSVKLLSLESKIRVIADEPSLNINSSRQLGYVLFEKMRITDKPKMTKTKQYCTDEEYLQSFAHKHEIVDLILQYRGIKKLLSTYVDALPLLVNSSTGHIHTSYNQAVTATGRLSSTNPNLQNIPIREQIGRPIREAFIPSDADHCLLSADYSQVELRIMAHLSGDESLCNAFRNGEDIHAATAAKIYGKSIYEVTPEERRRAKTANFGIIYGISAFGLSQRLDIPRSEAKELIDSYFVSYPKVREYMERVQERARIDGYVTTLFGRRRYLADISSRNANARALAERNAINAPIQGSAADIMKIAMIEVKRCFEQEGIISRIILQVHDEIVVDTLLTERESVERIVRKAMEGAASLAVPLVVDCGVGRNWLEAH